MDNQFCVIEFSAVPSNVSGKYAIVPKSWTREVLGMEQEAKQKVGVAYPADDPEQVQSRVKKNGPCSSSWPFYIANLLREVANYKEAKGVLSLLETLENSLSTYNNEELPRPPASLSRTSMPLSRRFSTYSVARSTSSLPNPQPDPPTNNPANNGRKRAFPTDYETDGGIVQRQFFYLLKKMMEFQASMLNSSEAEVNYERAKVLLSLLQTLEKSDSTYNNEELPRPSASLSRRFEPSLRSSVSPKDSETDSRIISLQKQLYGIMKEMMELYTSMLSSNNAKDTGETRKLSKSKENLNLTVTRDDRGRRVSHPDVSPTVLKDITNDTMNGSGGKAAKKTHNSKYTLKHQNFSNELVELLPNSNVYVSGIKLLHCQQQSKDASKLSRNLMTEVFSDEALKTCSLLGGGGKPGLDAEAMEVLFEFVNQHSERMGWHPIDKKRFHETLRGKMGDVRKSTSPKKPKLF